MSSYATVAWRREISQSRSSGQGEPGPSFGLAFQTETSRSKQGLWQAAQSVSLLNYLGQRPLGYTTGDAATGGKVRKRGAVGSWKARSHERQWECPNCGNVCPAWEHRDRGGSQLPWDTLPRTYTKSPSMPTACPTTWKRPFISSGVNLSKSPLSLGLGSYSYKVVPIAIKLTSEFVRWLWGLYGLIHARYLELKLSLVLNLAIWWSYSISSRSTHFVLALPSQTKDLES